MKGELELELICTKKSSRFWLEINDFIGCFIHILEYLYGTKFEERPDYSWIKS
jgi:hypothetical protein